MKIKLLIFALGFGLMLLSGCVAALGPDYVYYPSTSVYYAPVQPYYCPPVVVPRPYYRRPYWPLYDTYRQNRGNGYRPNGNGYNGNGNYDQRTYGHSRRRGSD
ncbi:hypothetical protein IC235_07540 [Hymenobacter sp. BT664]|uniref:Lipoprotein n=1 Tax=Hymenobacter montanus TaxID=2771359 RepID=A0A927BCT1_9BACT|nr:hypothetical protein [Hymenobacter montanus]MBD2767744.1 hypothetical protein [Hymenobacter montanus]